MRIRDEIIRNAKPRRAVQGMIAFSRFVVAALEGDIPASKEAFAAADALWTVVGAPLDLAIMRTVFAHLMDRDDADGIVAGARARAFFEEHQLRGWLDRFADVLPPAEALDASLAG